MRIIAGLLRGRRVEVGAGVRPTGGRLKEALFSRWQDSIPNSIFLDLFAGSGAMGLEAISRGARHAVQVERAAGALHTIQKNGERLAPGRCTVLKGTLPKLPDEVMTQAPFTHVFVDPPYDFENYRSLLEQLPAVLEPVGEVAVEHSRRVRLGEAVVGLTLVDSRDYGESRLSFFTTSAES